MFTWFIKMIRLILCFMSNISDYFKEDKVLVNLLKTKRGFFEIIVKN